MAATAVMDGAINRLLATSKTEAQFSQGVQKLVNHPTALSTHAEDLVNRAANINELHAGTFISTKDAIRSFYDRGGSASWDA